MKNKRIIIINLLSLLFLNSCGTKIEDKNYNSYTLTYKELSDQEGYRYKYLKEDTSKEFGEKVYKIYKNIIGSNESYINLNNVFGFEHVKYYIFRFNEEGSYDELGISSEDNNVFVFYNNTNYNTPIYFLYKSLSSGYLNEINELKSTFKEMLKDNEWVFEKD